MRLGIPQSLENKGKLRQLVDKLEFLSLNSINVAGFILFRYNICLIFGLKVEDFLHLQRVRCFR